MKITYIIFIPIVLVLVSAIASVLAFRQDKILEQGYLYAHDETATTVFAGTYWGIVSNIGYDTTHISFVPNDEDGIYISLYDDSSTLASPLAVFQFSIQTSDGDVVPIDVDVDPVPLPLADLDDTAFSVDLDAGSSYDFFLIPITLSSTYPPETIDIDIALVHLDQDAYLMKGIWESVTYTSAIFAVISGFTIGLILRYKKGL